MKIQSAEVQKSIVVPEENAPLFQVIESVSVFSLTPNQILGFKEYLASAFLTPAPANQEAMIDRAEGMLAVTQAWNQEMLEKQNGSQLSAQEQCELDELRTATANLQDYLAAMTVGMTLIRRVR